MISLQQMLRDITTTRRAQVNSAVIAPCLRRPYDYKEQKKSPNRRRVQFDVEGACSRNFPFFPISNPALRSLLTLPHSICLSLDDYLRIYSV